jgi:hypothetical protein
MNGRVCRTPRRSASVVATCSSWMARSPRTREQIAGFDILDCADLDEAMEVAAKPPVARFGSLELRPFAE